jgi:putative NADH-flavin reductase
MARVLIIGASRGIGLETVKAALHIGHSVRALARSAGRIPVEHPKLEKMAVDALQVPTVKCALTGVDVVIQSLGVAAAPEIIFKPTRLFSAATRVLVTAGGSNQAVDLRDGLWGWRQPWLRRVSL